MEMSLCSFLCSSTLGIKILLVLGGSGCAFSSYLFRDCASLIAASLCFPCLIFGGKKSTIYKKWYSLRQLYFNCTYLVDQEQYKMGKEEMRSTLHRCGSIISLRWIWDLHIMRPMATAWIQTAAFWWTTLLIIFTGIKSLQLMSFFSSLYCLTLSLKKIFCTSSESIIYCRPLEISRDNCKAKKSAFSLLLEILECFFSWVTKDWKQILFFSCCFCCLQNFGSLSKHCLSTNILIKIWSYTFCQQRTVLYWEGGRK